MYSSRQDILMRVMSMGLAAKAGRFNTSLAEIYNTPSYEKAGEKLCDDISDLVGMTNGKFRVSESMVTEFMRVVDSYPTSVAFERRIKDGLAAILGNVSREEPVKQRDIIDLNIKPITVQPTMAGRVSRSDMVDGVGKFVERIVKEVRAADATTLPLVIEYLKEDMMALIHDYISKCSVGWETNEEYEMESLAFAIGNNTDYPVEVRQCVVNLWREYCLAAETKKEIDL